MPDKHGYPTEEEIQEIENWNFDFSIGNNKRFINYLKSIWWTPEWGFVYKLKKRKLYLELHTGGWSGNEEIKGVLKKTLFWNFYWQKSVRGGHYYFEIEIPKDRK